MMIEDLYEYAMATALQRAALSHDPSTQNGATVITWNIDSPVYTWGENNFLPGVKETDERWDRPMKYDYVEHAERRALYNASKRGFNLAGSTLVCPWAACGACANAIVGLGIKTLVRLPMADDAIAVTDRWGASIVAGDNIMREGGVNIIEKTFTFDKYNIPTLRRNGEPWSPLSGVLS